LTDARPKNEFAVYGEGHIVLLMAEDRFHQRIDDKLGVFVIASAFDAVVKLPQRSFIVKEGPKQAVLVVVSHSYRIANLSQKRNMIFECDEVNQKVNWYSRHSNLDKNFFLYNNVPRKRRRNCKV
jgi:hypothetical protein